MNTSPSESEEDELLAVEEDEESLESDDESDDEEDDDDDEELELCSLFFVIWAGFFPLPLCSCSSCLASSRWSICSFRSRAVSSSCSSDFSHVSLSASPRADFDLAAVWLARVDDEPSREFCPDVERLSCLTCLSSVLRASDCALFLLLWVCMNLHLVPYEQEPLWAHCLQ